jgi:hypothetical protein
MRPDRRLLTDDAASTLYHQCTIDRRAFSFVPDSLKMLQKTADRTNKLLNDERTLYSASRVHAAFKFVSRRCVAASES